MNDQEVWYKNGLRFGCTACGKCCRGGPGVVWVSEEECVAIASALGVCLEEFHSKYTRMLGERRALKEIGKEWDCVLLKAQKQCIVYLERPRQCKSFPWWKGILASQEAWKETKKYCEGLDHPRGRLYTKEEIDRLQS